MPNKKKLGASIAAGAITLSAMFYTVMGQAPQGGGPAAAAQAPIAAVLQNYQPVTAERLKNPDPASWLMVRRTYDGWGYSPLNQITTSNVSRLKPVWGLLTGEARVHE